MGVLGRGGPRRPLPPSHKHSCIAYEAPTFLLLPLLLLLVLLLLLLLILHQKLTMLNTVYCWLESKMLMILMLLSYAVSLVL